MKYKIKYNNKSYFVKAKDAQSAIDGLSILAPELKDDRLSPMTYKKLKELGYTHEKWKDLSQEQANKIVARANEPETKPENESKQETSKTTAKLSKEDVSKNVNSILKNYNNKNTELKTVFERPDGSYMVSIRLSRNNFPYEIFDDEIKQRSNNIVKDLKKSLNGNFNISEKKLYKGSLVHGVPNELNVVITPAEELKNELVENENNKNDVLSTKNLSKDERKKQYESYRDKIIVDKYEPTTDKDIQNTVNDIERLFKADTLKKKQLRNEYINQIKDEPKITNDMVDVSKQLNLPLINLDFRVKTPKSFAEKVSRPETDLDKFEVTDSVRYTFTANKSTDVEKTLNALEKKGYKVVKFSNYWQPEDSAYRGINVKLKTDNNHIIEVQFHTVEDLLVKEYNHEKFYETQRNFAPDSEEYKHLDNLQKENTRDLITPEGMKTLRWDIQNKDK